MTVVVPGPGKEEEVPMLISGMSDTQWWIAAVVSGLALGVALMSMARTRGRRLGALLVPPLGGAASVFGQSAVRGDSGREACFLYMLMALDLVVLRLIYTPWIRRQTVLYQEGKPVTVVGPKQVTVFMLLFVAVAVLVAFLIH
jgi:hypothetical protein